MITTAKVAECEERNEITFPTLNGLSAKTRSNSDCVSPSLRKRGGKRDNEGEREKEEEKAT